MDSFTLTGTKSLS